MGRGQFTHWLLHPVLMALSQAVSLCCDVGVQGTPGTEGAAADQAEHWLGSLGPKMAGCQGRDPATSPGDLGPVFIPF